LQNLVNPFQFRLFVNDSEGLGKGLHVCRRTNDG